MRTLIIHHLEPCWESGYVKLGTNFYEFVRKFRRHLQRAKYDKVILTRMEDHLLSEDHFPVSEYIDEIHQYGYGWEESEIVEGQESRWCNGGYHSQIVFIDEWMKKLPKSKVFISGAFDGECIEDLEIALTHLKVKFRRIPSLII
jgi:hypothetical protein